MRDEQLALTHLGQAESEDIVERIRLACESVVQCAIHLTQAHPSAVWRAAYDGAHRWGVAGMDRLQGVPEEVPELEPDEFEGFARGTKETPVVP
jgi:hypothetical protein